MVTFDAVIIGAGPAGLFAADYLSKKGHKVALVERRAQAGWKLLVAGSSGLNVSFADERTTYKARKEEMLRCLEFFGRESWLAYLNSLGEETFMGTSRRYFIRSPKAAGLLKNWLSRLQEQKVEFFFSQECESLTKNGNYWIASLKGLQLKAPSVLLSMGSPSWDDATDSRLKLLEQLNLKTEPFTPSNAGFELEASSSFFSQAQGKPIKGFILRVGEDSREGEAMITRYGLEGTPLYSIGRPGPAKMDLKPGVSAEKLASRLNHRDWKNQWPSLLKLSEGAVQFARYFLPTSAWASPKVLAEGLKEVSFHLKNPRPLTESISAKGGLSWDELDDSLQAKPGLFAAGELVDWDAPTGGYLLQGCISMAAVAANGIDKYLREQGLLFGAEKH